MNHNINTVTSSNSINNSKTITQKKGGVGAPGDANWSFQFEKNWLWQLKLKVRNNNRVESGYMHRCMHIPVTNARADFE